MRDAAKLISLLPVRETFVATIVLFTLIIRRDCGSPPILKKNYAGPLESLASADVKYFMPSTGEVIICHVPSLAER